MTRTLRRAVLLVTAAPLALSLLAPATSLAQQTVTTNQTQNAAVNATTDLTVVENYGLTQADAQATGNTVQGGNDGANATVYTYQVLHGAVNTLSTVTGTNTGNEDISLGTPVYVTSQAIGNYGSTVTQNATLAAQVRQTSDTPAVSAGAEVTAPNNAIYVSGEADATAEVNHQAYEVINGRLDAAAWQSSATDALAISSATVHYSPSPNAYNANATNNYYGSYSGDRGSQEHTVTQDTSGMTRARAELYGGNMWNSQTNATAVANNVNLQNTGGSLVVDNHQTQSGAVLAQAHLEADQYGSAFVTASGVGNQMSAGNNDIYVRVNNDQLSTGGVDVTAEFVGNAGYDGYVTADAVGNQALAYACSTCQADMGVSSTQVNNSDVNATATASVAQGRTIVSTARATGNSATWYVSR